MKQEPLYGHIRTQKKCPKCQKVFQHRERLGFICPDCLTTPDRYYLDLYHQGDHYPIFSDRKGKILDAYSSALFLQREISREIEAKTFDPSRYVRRKQAEFWISTLLDRFFAYKIKEVAPSNQKDYRRHVRLAKKFFGETDVREIRKMDLIKYKEGLEGDFPRWSAKTLKNCLDQFRAFLRWCWQTLEILEGVPSMPEMQVPEAGFRWLDKESQIALFDHIPPVDLPIIAFMALHGIRPGEARALTLKDFDLGKGTFTVSRTFSGAEIRDRRKGRGAKAITLPLHPEMREIVESRAKEALPAAFLFVNPRNGLPYSQNKLRRVWEAVRQSAGISRDLRLYDATRHSFASQLINSGSDISSISRLLGHSSLKMTMRYAHHDIGKLRTDLEKLTLKKVLPWINIKDIASEK